MRLDEVTDEDQAQEALDDGDQELQWDIEHAVAKLVQQALQYPQYEEFENVQALTRHVNRSDFLNMVARIVEPILAVIPEGQRSWHGDMWAEVYDATDVYLSVGRARRQRGVVWWEEGAESWDADVVATVPIMMELSVDYDVPLLHIPVDVIEDALYAEVPDADWEQTGEGVWSSNWIDSNQRLSLFTTGARLREWAQDRRQDYFSEMVDAEPEVAAKALMRLLDKEHPALAKKVRKLKLPVDALGGYASVYFDDPEIGLVVIKEATGAFGYKGSRGKTLLTVTKDTLRELGITSGKWWDGAPWKLISLPKEELAYEGVLMRHCVGRPDMGYRDAVEGEQIYIWSLRSQFNKPVLTWEVDREAWDFWTKEHPHSPIGEQLAGRAAAIEQLKGRLNRVPPKDKQENDVLLWIFDRLRVAPTHVVDFVGRSQIVDGEVVERWPEANPSGRTFDEPCRFAHSRPARLPRRARRRGARRPTARPKKRQRRSSADIVRKYLRNL